MQNSHPGLASTSLSVGQLRGFLQEFNRSIGVKRVGTPKSAHIHWNHQKVRRPLKKRPGMAESVSNHIFCQKKVLQWNLQVVQSTSEKFLRASCARWFQSSESRVVDYFHGTWDVDPKWLDIFGAGRNRNHQAVKWFWALMRNSRFVPGGIWWDCKLFGGRQIASHIAIRAETRLQRSKGTRHSSSSWARCCSDHMKT